MLLVDSFYQDMKSLDVKDLGTVSKFLGIRVDVLGDHAYALDQEHMIKALLDSHGMCNGDSPGGALVNSAQEALASVTLPLRHEVDP
jgi:hypothetical protein